MTAERSEAAVAGRKWAAGAVSMVVVLGLAVAAGGAMLRERELPASAGPVAHDVAVAVSAAPDTAPAAPKSSRVIEDTQTAALPRGRESGWVREAPRAALGPSQIVPLKPEVTPGATPAPPQPAPGEPRPTLLFQPVATAAGRIEAAGHVVELEGVEVLDPTQQCTGANGQSWPCGTVARAAFRSWLRGRAVECTVAPLPGEAPVVSTCRLGKENASAWLVANGYAVALAGGAYEQAGAEAKAARRGIFGDRPKRVSVTVSADGILPDLAQETAAPGGTGAFPAPPVAPAVEVGTAPEAGQPMPEAVTPSP